MYLTILNTFRFTFQNDIFNKNNIENIIICEFQMIRPRN